MISGGPISGQAISDYTSFSSPPPVTSKIPWHLFQMSLSILILLLLGL